MQTKRLYAFDVLKLFAIFMVLWGHSVQYLLSGLYLDKPIYVYIYSFHMPLFMIISGYFSVKSLQLDFPSFFKKKAMSLLWPCVPWGILMLFVWSSLKYKFDFTQVSAMDFRNYIVESFWFLKSCFCCYLLSYLSYRLGKYKVAAFAVTLLLSQFTMQYGLRIMYPCFLMGILLKEYPAIMQFVRRYSLFIGILFLLLLTAWDKSFLQPNVPIWKYLYRFALGTVGSLAIIGLFRRLFDNVDDSKSWVKSCCDWGKYTLEVYILQCFILESFLAVLLRLDKLGTFVGNLIATPLISFGILWLCIVITKNIYKSKMLAYFLFGR